MATCHRLSLKIAAATGLAAVVWVVTPAVAAESMVTGSGAAAATAHHAPFDIKRHASKTGRFAASRNHRPVRRVSAIRGDLDCSGLWCGRQFVLMLGIGF